MYRWILVAAFGFVALAAGQDDQLLKLQERYRVNIKGDAYETRTKQESWKPIQRTYS